MKFLTPLFAPKPAPAAPVAPPTIRQQQECDFEEQLILPMIDAWGWLFTSQYPCSFYIGSYKYSGKVDVYVRGPQKRSGVTTIFENKAKITTESQWERAAAQAKSYALMLGSPSFCVAAPQGLRVYSLSWNVEHLHQEFTPAQMKRHDVAIRDLVLDIRRKQRKQKH